MTPIQVAIVGCGSISERRFTLETDSISEE